jgi:hypothetical protein
MWCVVSTSACSSVGSPLFFSLRQNTVLVRFIYIYSEAGLDLKLQIIVEYAIKNPSLSTFADLTHKLQENRLRLSSIKEKYERQGQTRPISLGGEFRRKYTYI